MGGIGPGAYGNLAFSLMAADDGGGLSVSGRMVGG